MEHRTEHKKNNHRRKYKCVVCSETFSQMKYLSVHCKRKHDASDVKAKNCDNDCVVKIEIEDYVVPKVEIDTL